MVETFYAVRVDGHDLWDFKRLWVCHLGMSEVCRNIICIESALTGILLLINMTSDYSFTITVKKHSMEE